MNRLKFIAALFLMVVSAQASVVIDFAETAASGTGVFETVLTLNNLSDAVTLTSSMPPAVPAISTKQNRFSSAGVSGAAAIKMKAVAEFNPATWSIGEQPARLGFFLGNANWPGWGVLSAVVRTGFLDEGEAIIFTLDLNSVKLPTGHVLIFKGITFHPGSKYSGEVWIKRTGESPVQFPAQQAGQILRHGDQISALQGTGKVLLQTIEFDVMSETDAIKLSFQKQTMQGS